MPTAKRILIVDDEVEILELLEIVFQSHGYEVTTAESGNGAFEIFQKQTFDLVLSDIRMHNGTGIDLLKNIKGSGNTTTPVVFLTGFSDVSEEQSIAMGAHTVLAKPIDSKILLDVVKSVLTVESSVAG